MSEHTSTLLIPPRVGSPTPWGPVQDLQDARRGVVLVTGAKHWGYWLDHEARSAMPDELRTVRTLVALRTLVEGQPTPPPGHWYEGGEDHPLVLLSWPELDPYATWALLDGEGWRWYRTAVRDAIRGWRGAARMRAEDVAKAWGDEHAGWWLKTRARSSGAGWLVSYQQVGSGDQAVRSLTDEEYVAASESAVPTLPGEPAGRDRVARGAV